VEEAAKAHNVRCVISGDVVRAFVDDANRLSLIGHEKIRGIAAERRCWTAHDQGFAQCGESQVAVQPVACRPAHDPACEQVDDNGQVQPTFAGPP
jgi:hypothetical protein